MCNFGHLHLHTEYSTLDGMGRIEELILTAKEMGQTFLAITDHGTTSGLWEAQRLGEKHGIKIIFGNEFYYERENDQGNGHLVVLARSNKGLENIFKMQEISYVSNFYKKPRINWDILRAHHEDLIVTSSCLGSTFNQLLMKGEHLEATKWARKFQEVFGEDFYIEIQPNKLPEQYIANTGAIRIARQLGIRIVATNDVHYTFESDCFPHEVLLALQMNRKMSDEKRFRFSTTDFWLKSEEEMLETFSEVKIDEAIVREALATTREIAEKCNARIEKGNFLPSYYDVPKGETERSLLVKHTMEGAKEKGVIKDTSYMKETQEEVDVIDRNGYSGYFLIVQDYVNSARNAGIIVGDGRGSGSGSKVAFLTDITKIEPSKYDLLFERFMADGRQPDFDVDFSDQDAVFADLQRKYGAENVARIIAFGTLTPKAVTRKVLNAFEHPMHEIGAITKLIDESCETMAQAYANSEELRRIRSKLKTEFDVIERLEGIVSHESKHAGGVIIYPHLASILPIKSDSTDRGKRIVGFDKYMLEEIGHYKFDILGLETLPIIRRTLDSIRAETGEELNLDTIDLEDKDVYDMLCKGDVSGIFQINNQAGKVMEQQPRCFRDLIAINALIRPGVGDWNEYIARRRGRTWVKDDNRPWMHDTLGVIAYQEQYMWDAHILCGWSVAEADKLLRKGKDVAQNEDLRYRFINDGIGKGHHEDYMRGVWEEILGALGDYSFCKGHAASYAVTLFKTAYLKCHYPNHFYASMMTSEGDDQDAISGYVAECKARGININPPNINSSGGDFVVNRDSIDYRITTIKHVGESAINHLYSLRPVRSFDEFVQRREKSQIKQNVLVNLIKAGCFDFDNPDRSELLWQLDMLNRKKTDVKNGVECPRYEWNDKVKAEWEKEALGMYLSVHPMEKYGFKPFDTYAEESKCLAGGEVIEVVERPDKKGNQMAFIRIDTLFGVIRVLAFSHMWARESVRAPFQVGNLVLVKGKKSGDAVLLDEAEVLT